MFFFYNCAEWLRVGIVMFSRLELTACSLFADGETLEVDDLGPERIDFRSASAKKSSVSVLSSVCSVCSVSSVSTFNAVTEDSKPALLATHGREPG